MPAHMVIHEGRDKVIGMAVPGLHAQCQIDRPATAGLFQPLRKKHLEKIVGIALIH